MTRLRFTKRKLPLGMAIAVFVVVVAMAYFMISEPNARSRAEVESILLSASTPQQQLTELAPFVKVGDKISAVDKKISPRPDEATQVDRPTEHAYGLGGVSLVLAINANGTVVGIGRHKNGIDDGTSWLAPPSWSGA